MKIENIPLVNFQHLDHSPELNHLPKIDIDNVEESYDELNLLHCDDEEFSNDGGYF